MANKKNHATQDRQITHHVLPSLTVLLSESWELYKKTWLVYLKLVCLAVSFIFLALLIGFIISLPINWWSMGSTPLFRQHLTPFQIADLVLIGIWVIFLFVSIIAIDVIFPIVGIFILDGKDTQPLFGLMKQSKKYFWLYFLTSLLTGFLVIGGMGLLVVPGIIFAIFFAFATYEVVLGQQTVQSALKRSYFMVKNNFWSVVGRLLLVEICYEFVSNVLNRARSGDFLFITVSILFSFFAGWYIKVYIFLLYRQLHKTVNFSEAISLRWTWIVSIVGWVILIIIGVSVSSFLSHINHMPALSPHPHHPRANGAV